MGRWTLTDASKEAQAYIIIVLGIVAVAWLGLGWQAGVATAGAAAVTFLATAFAFVDRIAELREDLGKADAELDEYDELRAEAESLYATMQDITDHGAFLSRDGYDATGELRRILRGE